PARRAIAPPAGRAGRPGRTHDEPVIVVALPRATTLHVAEETVPRVADPSGGRRQRSDARLIGHAVHRIEERTLGVGPAIIALNAEHPTARELIIAAALHAADPAVGVVTAEGSDRIRRRQGPILARPQATDVTADIAAGPVVNDDGWWRLIERRLDRHVGCHGRASTQQGDKRDADEFEVSHITFPNCTLDTPPTGISIFQKARIACSRS